MSCLRWWAEKVNKQNVIAGPMTTTASPDRKFIGEQSKAQQLDMEKLEQIRDPHVRMSLRLQAAFGLRREGSTEDPAPVERPGDYLQLKASWTKGGRPRTVPIRTDAQRTVLEDAKALAGLGP